MKWLLLIALASAGCASTAQSSAQMVAKRTAVPIHSVEMVDCREIGHAILAQTKNVIGQTYPSTLTTTDKAVDAFVGGLKPNATDIAIISGVNFGSTGYYYAFCSSSYYVAGGERCTAGEEMYMAKFIVAYQYDCNDHERYVPEAAR